MSIKLFSTSVTYRKVQQENKPKLVWHNGLIATSLVNVRLCESITKALLARKEAVLSCIVFPYSNDPMEGINNKIKLIKRRGYGYRNIQRFALRVRLETAIIC
jgi:Transposase